MHFVSYEIAADDTIAAVGADWGMFALENGAPELMDVVGEPLFDFIAGAAIRQVYRELLARVRHGQRVVFPFRCDSPDIVREMSMIISALDQGHVRFESFLLRTSPRTARPIAAIPSRFRVCSWCKRVVSGGEWRYPEFAIEAMTLFDPLHAPVLMHDICEECAAMLSVARPETPRTNNFD